MSDAPQMDMRPGRARVRFESARVRAFASRSSRILATLRRGAVVTVLHQTAGERVPVIDDPATPQSEAGNTSLRWLYVETERGQRGYVAADLLEEVR